VPRLVLSCLSCLPDIWIMKTIQVLYDYFLHNCESHVDLAHDMSSGNRVFQLVSVEQALGDFRSGAQHQGYLVRLIEYTYGITQLEHEATKEIQFGFIVAKYFREDADGSSAYVAAMSSAERVMDDFLAKMVADSRNGHPLFDHYFDSRQDVNVQPVLHTGDGNYCGWMAIVRTPQYFEHCYTPAPDRWTDGGLTPYT